jgi:hypothetical protein
MCTIVDNRITCDDGKFTIVVAKQRSTDIISNIHIRSQFESDYDVGNIYEIRIDFGNKYVSFSVDMNLLFTFPIDTLPFLYEIRTLTQQLYKDKLPVGDTLSDSMREFLHLIEYKYNYMVDQYYDFDVNNKSPISRTVAEKGGDNYILDFSGVELRNINVVNDIKDTIGNQMLDNFLNAKPTLIKSARSTVNN